MRGYAALGSGKLDWVEHDEPVMGPNDAIVKPIAVATCSSDVHYAMTYDGSRGSVIVGHEAIGEVVDVGSEVKLFKPGDRVIVSPSTPDMLHPEAQVRFGNNAHAKRLMGGFAFVGEKDGVFAERFNVNHADANMVHWTDDVSLEDALMMLDMMNTGFYGAEQADIQYGDKVVVFGIGPVGLMSVAGAALRGAGDIFAIGSRPNCVELAKEYGATHIINYKNGDVVEQIMDIAGGKIDKVVIAGGDGKVLTQALMLTKPNGIVSNVNYFDKSDSFAFPALAWGLGMSDVKIVGGFCPGGSLRLEKLLNIIKAGRVHPGKLMNYRFEGMDAIPEALKVMKEKPSDLIKPGIVIGN